jgi:predicted Rossmann fold nucleotide-binding protein DprA/Smf involved in DNA uptake
VRSGLAARTRILDILNGDVFSAPRLARESALTYSVVVHHLNLLRQDGKVERKGNRRYVWLSTGIGQKRLY